MEKAHKKLKAWQEAIALAKPVYQVTERLPAEERFCLASQMRRAAISVASNIAEGAARSGERDSLQFFIIARSSLSELDTQVVLCSELRLLAASDISLLSSHIDTEDALLSGLIRFKRKGR
jgi:four helix bundle protein